MGALGDEKDSLRDGGHDRVGGHGVDVFSNFGYRGKGCWGEGSISPPLSSARACSANPSGVAPSASRENTLGTGNKLGRGTCLVPGHRYNGGGQR